MSTDDNEKGPDTKPTLELSKDEINSALLKDIQRRVDTGFRSIEAHVGTLASAIDVLQGRVSAHDKQFAEFGERANRHSDGVRGVSESDLKQQAQLAEGIVKQRELEAKIEETHALAKAADEKVEERDAKIEATHALAGKAAAQVEKLAETAATKDDVQKLAASTVTKAEVAAVVEAATTAQTTAILTPILTRFDAVARNPMVRNVAYAIGGAILAALATCSKPPLAPPPPAPPPITAPVPR